jgi:hypothetical protein
MRTRQGLALALAAAVIAAIVLAAILIGNALAMTLLAARKPRMADVR